MNRSMGRAFMAPNPSDSSPGQSVEFDAYASGYSAGNEDPFKRLIGGTFEAFIDVKTGWLLRDLAKHPVRAAAALDKVRLLDFGCGTGELLQSLRQQGFQGELAGCDISEQMLAEAARRWRCGPPPQLHLHGDGARLPYPD